jgi:hypothetical protein
LLSLIDDHDYRRELGAAGRTSVEERFNSSTQHCFARYLASQAVAVASEGKP